MSRKNRKDFIEKIMVEMYYWRRYIGGLKVSFQDKEKSMSKDKETWKDLVHSFYIQVALYANHEVYYVI